MSDGLREPREGDEKFITLNLTYGSPTSKWCDSCFLPSRLEVPIHALGENGPSQIGTFSQCDGCAGEATS